MTIHISGDWFCFIIPAIILILTSLQFDSQRTGGGYFPASSDRDAFWFVGFPAWLILSFAAWAIYLKVTK